MSDARQNKWFPRADVTRGDAGDLVTPILSGTVNPMGAVAGRVLTTDGVTNGGVWQLLGDANIAVGANIAVAKLAAGAINTTLQTNGAGNVVWAAAAGGVLVTAIVQGEVNTLGAADTVFQSDGVTAGGVWRNFLELPAAGYVQLGLDAGSGAGSAAGAGSVRLQKDFVFSYRNSVDGADHTAVSSRAASDYLYIGGTDGGSRPNSIIADSSGGIELHRNGTLHLYAFSNALRMYQSLLEFEASQPSPVIDQQPLTATATTGQLLTVQAQTLNSAGTGASTGGALLLAGGDGTHTDDHGGHTYVRGGRNVGAGTGSDANVALHVQVTDAVNFQSGERILYIGDAVAAPAANAANGSFLWSASAVLTTSQLAMPAAGYLQMGLVAGSGAGSAAATGGVRLQGNGAVQGRIVFRGHTDAADVAGISSDANSWTWLGGPHPTRPDWIIVDPIGTFAIRINGFQQYYFNSSGLHFAQTAHAIWDAGCVAPTVLQAALAAPATTGQLFTIQAQTLNSAGAGASTGGALLLAGGDGTHADDHGGHTYVRGGRNVGAGTGSDANVALHVQATDAVNFQSGERIIYIGDAVAAPAANAANGSFLWSASAVLTTSQLAMPAAGYLRIGDPAGGAHPAPAAATGGVR
ncbi:MAG: hypothetical protein JRD89_02595, partial [Deltaproteobacteria bacterium]|nr:hypothetical protein [Deltaproteobacteria bacterium]